MTDKVKYTVTIEVEADAVGPAQAIRQALDWARDTESGPAVITVQASNLSPLRATVADGRVAQLFTGPVYTGVDPASGPDSTVHATIRQGVDPDRLRDLVNDWHQVARNIGLVNTAFDRTKAAQLGADVSRLLQCAHELEALIDDR